MRGVDITLHRTGAGWDGAGFAAAVGPLLRADPVRHTLALTVLDRWAGGSGKPALLLSVRRRAAVVGFALREHGRPVLVSGLPPVLAAAVVARALAVDPRPTGVSGPVPEAEAHAAAHAAATGAVVRVAMRQRLFRLVALTPPVAGPGTCRLAGPSDVDLLARWQTGFLAEAAGALGPSDDPRPGIVEALAGGAGHVLWERDGEPVAYAVARRPVGGTARVGPVYTPPEHRGHGYGSAVTAAATAWAQRAGAREVCLFTDLANPVSNAIYPRLGYRPVLDAVELAFRP
jgi:GNAT superfamily N-acetyltransferase